MSPSERERERDFFTSGWWRRRCRGCGRWRRRCCPCEPGSPAPASSRSPPACSWSYTTSWSWFPSAAATTKEKPSSSLAHFFSCKHTWATQSQSASRQRRRLRHHQHTYHEIVVLDIASSHAQKRAVFQEDEAQKRGDQRHLVTSLHSHLLLCRFPPKIDLFVCCVFSLARCDGKAGFGLLIYSALSYSFARKRNTGSHAERPAALWTLESLVFIVHLSLFSI